MGGRSQDFVTHFVKQDSWLILLVMSVPAAVYLGLLAFTVAIIRRVPREQSKRFVGAVYESLALYFRSVPPGSGLERQSSYDTYVAGAQASLIALYLLIVGGAALLGRVMLHTWR